jgi:uncharacterized protein (DUF2252 family)
MSVAVDAEAQKMRATGGAAIPPIPLTDFAARSARGRSLRSVVPLSAHAEWESPGDRPDPVGLLKEQEASRVAELIPIRYQRMMASAFTFYRGAALIMASDLSRTPTTALTVQLCGDAHLSNFGLFGTPERNLIFDINDFDETLPGPFEWDVKRLAASFEVAGQANALSATERRDVVRRVARSYRETMREVAAAPILTAWYERMDADKALKLVVESQKTHHASKSDVRRANATITKARDHTSILAYTKLVGIVDGQMVIQAQPPLIIPIESLTADTQTKAETEQYVRDLIASYAKTLPLINHPIRDFTYAHAARKVVGVGSVGTRAWVILLRGRDNDDPLILQAKEAQASVLERFVAPSEYSSHAQRVVEGQRLMQSATDIFLGWQSAMDVDGTPRDFYLRQLYDLKGSADVDNMNFASFLIYAEVCGQALARAHAKGTSFDSAIAAFASKYAKQNVRDYAQFLKALTDGRLNGPQSEPQANR